MDLRGVRDPVPSPRPLKHNTPKCVHRPVSPLPLPELQNSRDNCGPWPLEDLVDSRLVENGGAEVVRAAWACPVQGGWGVTPKNRLLARGGGAWHQANPV